MTSWDLSEEYKGSWTPLMEKSLHGMHHVWRMKGKIHSIILVDADETFVKIQFFQDEKFQKTPSKTEFPHVIGHLW